MMEGKLHTVNETVLKLGLTAVKDNGLAFEFISVQTTELCMAVVYQDRWVLKFVREQTPDICMVAVKHNGFVL